MPPLWVSSKVHEGELKARLYVTAAAAAALAFIGAGLIGSAPVDAMGSATGPRADVGVGIVLVAIAIGAWTAVVHRQRVFPDASAPAGSPTQGDRSLPGVQEAQVRRQRRALYRSLVAEDVVLAREMGLGRPAVPPSSTTVACSTSTRWMQPPSSGTPALRLPRPPRSSAPARDWCA